MITNKPKQLGFTIVELLIVIIVIAILATLVITAYNGVQAKARDSKRLSDAKQIVKAITLYAADHNSQLPPHVSEPSEAVGWDRSYAASPGQWLTVLKPYGFSSGTPVDPINSSSYWYEYYNYAAGSYGCDASEGDFWVFAVHEFESMSAAQIKSPGFSCPDRNWAGEEQYVTGGFAN